MLILKDEEKLDEEVKVIKKDMDTLFKKLDALSHYQFRPPEVTYFYFFKYSELFTIL